MACGCQTKKRKQLSYVRSMAIKQSQLEGADMQIYQHTLQPYGLLYNYEPINDTRENIIEYVRYKS